MRNLLVIAALLIVLNGCGEQSTEQGGSFEKMDDGHFALELSPRLLEASLGDHLGLVFKVTLFGEKETLLELTEEDLAIAREIVVGKTKIYGLRILDSEIRGEFQVELASLLNAWLGEAVVNRVQVYQVSWDSPQLQLIEYAAPSPIDIGD